MRNQKGNEVGDGLVRTEELVVHSENILEDSLVAGLDFRRTLGMELVSYEVQSQRPTGSVGSGR